MPVQKVDEEDRRGILPRRKREKRRTRTGESGSTHGDISIRLDMHAHDRPPSPACDRSCAAANSTQGSTALAVYRHATHYAHRPGTYDFCEVRKENRAARVACNQSHVGTREMHCSALRRPGIRSVDRKYRARTFLRRRTWYKDSAACPFLTTHAVYCQGKSFVIV